MTKSKTWDVRFTLPPGGERRYAHNGSAIAVADTALGALSATIRAHPDAVVYQVNHHGDTEILFENDGHAGGSGGQ